MYARPDVNFDEILEEALNSATLSEVEKDGESIFEEEHENEIGVKIKLNLYVYDSKLYLVRYADDKCVEFREAVVVARNSSYRSMTYRTRTIQRLFDDYAYASTGDAESKEDRKKTMDFIENEIHERVSSAFRQLKKGCTSESVYKQFMEG